MINDDKPFVALTAAGVTIFGSPWSGKHGLDSNIAVPLAGICLLERGGADRICSISAAEAEAMLRKQAYCPMDPNKEDKLFRLLSVLSEKVPLYRMECTKNSSAALVAARAMHGENAVTLRPFEEADAQAVVDILMDEQVQKTYMVPDFASRENAKQLFDRLMTLSHEESRFVRAISADGKAVGMLNDVEISGGEVEVGYAVASRHWGRGYATRALKAAMESLFDRGFEKVKAAAFEENAASFRVMEKAGMVKTAQTEEICYRGKNHRCIYYEKNKN
jgi:RimJ/RimL family protein N-acetyltransferase